MTLQEKQLVQHRPLHTDATGIYSHPGAGITTVIKTIIIACVDGTGASFRIYHDDDGTTYNQDTALVWDSVIAGNEMIEMDTFIAMNNVNGNIAVRSSVTGSLTFTMYGAEIS